jgi:tyrosyl-tRNA synthetase
MTSPAPSGSGLLADLQARQCIFQTTDEKGVTALLAAGPATVYAGFDPTADSLHLGHLLPLLTLRRLQQAGHRPLVVLGGATGLVGDPSGKLSERVMQSVETVEAHAEALQKQLVSFLDFSDTRTGGRILNNREWIGSLDLIGFLRDVGKHFPVGAMLNKETVRTRLGKENTGLSYTEFSYLLLQAYDFDHLCQTEGCRLQIGGSDQWGNITAGIELIRRRRNQEAYGWTTPLVTTASGNKLGKTETGTLWLDARKTSPYAFYQYLLQVEDQDAGRFLRYFSERDLEAIEAIEAEQVRDPGKRPGQKALARELTTRIHGTGETERAIRLSETLFGSADVRTLDPESFRQLETAIPGTVLPREIPNHTLEELLVTTGLVTSKSRAREEIRAGAVSVNQKRVEGTTRMIGREDFLWDRYLLLGKGKRHHAWVRLGD